MSAYPHSLTLPWTVADTEERRFRLIVVIAVALTVVLGVIVPLLPVHKETVVRDVELPPRVAKLIIEKREQQKPRPIEKPKPEPEPVVKKTPPPKKKVAEKPRVVEKPSVVAKPKPEKPKTDATKLAREKASESGLLAMSDALADLRDQSSIDQLKGATRLSNSGSTAHKSERQLVTAKVSSGSNGIDTQNLTRDTGRTQLADRTATEVRSPLYAGDSGTGLSGAAGHAPVRSDEEIQVVFDRNKSAIYSLYNRELRRNPSLKGKIVIRLTIAPSGKVTDIELVSSELGLPRLEHKLIRRIKLFNFGAKSVEPITVTYPIQFLPA
jgi:TonB family protein